MVFTLSNDLVTYFFQLAFNLFSHVFPSSILLWSSPFPNSNDSVTYFFHLAFNSIDPAG